MVKINYLSDLHLEFYKKIDFDKLINFVDNGEILCLCGDIGYPEDIKYKEFLNYCSSKFKHIFLIPGNHEYYSNKNTKTIQSTNIILEELCSKFPNVHFMNNKVEYLEEYKLCIIGTTLWTEIPDFVTKYETKSYNDFNKIYYEYDNSKFRLNIDYMNLMNAESVEFLKESINNNKDHNKIVLTHHLPTYKVIAEKYKHWDTNYFFANRLDELIKDNNINVWLCGHSHIPNNINLEKTIVALNPIGYPGENAKVNFNEFLII